MAMWEKASGNKVNLTIMNGPDLVHSVTGDRFLVPRAA